MEPMQPPEPPQWRVLGVQAVTCWVDRIGSSPEVRQLELSTKVRERFTQHRCQRCVGVLLQINFVESSIRCVC